MLARRRPDVDHVDRRANRLLVVLDDDQGVAQVTQAEQRVDQAPVVPLVKADRRLVEDVEHTHQLRADLRGQADAVRLASAQRDLRVLAGPDITGYCAYDHKPMAGYT